MATLRVTVVTLDKLPFDSYGRVLLADVLGGLGLETRGEPAFKEWTAPSPAADCPTWGMVYYLTRCGWIEWTVTSDKGELSHG